MMQDRHLTTADVVRHLDGERDASAHLAGCTTCLSEVDAVRALRADARALGGPAPRDELLAGALARRAAGERVLVPTANVPARASRLRGHLVPLLAAAGVALVAGIALLSTSDDLTAASDHGELRVLDTVRAGRDVRVEYVPSALLAREPVLRVRLAARSADESQHGWALDHLDAGRFARGRDGRFRGTIHMPAEAVFAVVAVEDTTGTTIDANARRFWTLHVQDERGRPTIDALQQEDHHFNVTDWRRTLDVARRLTTLYPERPEGWNMLRAKEALLLGTAAADSVRGVYGRRYATLDSALAARRVDAEAAAHMWWFGREVRDTARARRWRERLLRDHPASAEAQMVGFFDVRERLRDPRGLLAAYDSAWAADSAGYIRQQLYTILTTAMRVGDSATIARWSARVLASNVSERSFMARRLADAGPAHQARARAALLEILRWLDGHDDRRRELDESRRELADRMSRWRSGWLGTLGAVQLAMGDARAALDTLTLATTLGWDEQAWRALSRAALATGDTALAVRAGAFGGADSVRHLLGVAPERWRALADSGRETAITRTLQASKRRRLRMDPTLADPDGRQRSLSARRNGRIAIVAFWSRWCGPSIAQLDQFDELASRLEREGIAVIAVTDEMPSPGLGKWLAARKLGFTPAHDTRGEAHAVFNTYGTPFYAVLDASGTLRYEKLATIHDAMSAAKALEAEAARERVAAAR